MPLIAYNLTLTPLVLAAGNPVPTLKASTSVGARGQGSDVTAEFLGLTAANYAALQVQQAAGSVQYEWTDLPEYNTFTLIVGSAQTDGSDLDLAFYADATLGLDTNPGTQALPVQTLTKLFNLVPIGGYRKSCQLFMAPGNYPWTSASFGVHGINKQQGVNTSPLAIIGAYSPIVAGLSSALTDNPLSAVATTVNVASTAGFPTSGTVKIDSEFIDYTGVTGTSFTGCTRGVSSSTAAAHLVGASVFQASYIVTAVNADGSVDVAGITALATGTGDSFAFAAPIVTLTDAGASFITAGVKAGMKVTIAGSTTPANDGTFLITAVTATSLAFYNAAGVAEAYTGAWSIIEDRYFGVPRMIVQTGAAAGQARLCAGNTATALLPAGAFASIVAGAIVRLETPSVIIQMAANFLTAFNAVTGFKGITWQRTAGNLLTLELAEAHFEGCILDVTTGGTLNLQRYARVLNPNPGPWSALGANNPFSALRTNGLFIDGSGATQNGSVTCAALAIIEGQHLYRNVDFLLGFNSYANLFLTHGRNSSVTAQGSFLHVNGTSAANRGKWQGTRAGTPYTFGAFEGSVMQLDTLDVQFCNGNPIQVGRDIAVAAGLGNTRGGSRAAIGDVSGTAANNTGVGIKYTKGSNVVIDAAGVSTTVSGVGGDTQGGVVAVDTKTYAQVRTADVNGVKGWPDTLAATINLGNRIAPPV